jgi:drug/metabolite transporter (DMT)-like permease
MRMIGIVLAVLGIAALVFGGMGYNRNRTVFDVGSMHASVSEHRNIPAAPIAGALLLIAGVAMIAVERRRA